MSTEKIISHIEDTSSDEYIFEEVHKRIMAKGDLPYGPNKQISVETLLNYLREMQKFELGRFLLRSKGLDGPHTDYIISHVYDCPKENIGEFEKKFLEELPTVKATQERFGIFQKQAEKIIDELTTTKEEVILSSIPCGSMRDLFSIDYKNNNIKLLGIDLDPNSIERAKELSQEYGLSDKCKFLVEDAFKLNIPEQTDILLSNGLNIYEKDPHKLSQLFKNFFNFLKNKGTLIISYLSYPISFKEKSSWKMDNIDSASLEMQYAIFAGVIEAGWSNYSNFEEMKKQLAEAGFTSISLHEDSASIFPTIVARKETEISI